jgi:hypothetical protein
MLKTVLTTTAISALLVSGALAQATTTTPAPAVKTDAMPAKTLNEAKFISAQGADQWVYSKFKGTDVLGPDNAHIGDVDDLLFDKSGKILGVVVGVGGFLGVGQKNVAIEMSAFQVVPADINSSTASKSNDPKNVKLKVAWTKDQLKNAPDFQYFKASSATTGMAPNTTTPAPARR